MNDAVNFNEESISRRKYAEAAIKQYHKFIFRENFVIVVFMILPFILLRLNLYFEVPGLKWLGPYWHYSVKSGQNVMFMQIFFVIPFTAYMIWSVFNLKEQEGWFFAFVDRMDKEGVDFHSMKARLKKNMLIATAFMLFSMIGFWLGILYDNLGASALFFSHGGLGCSLFCLRYFALAHYLEPRHRTLNQADRDSTRIETKVEN